VDLSSLLRRSHTTVRTLAGENSSVEAFMRNRYKRLVRRAAAGRDSRVEKAARRAYAAARFRLTGDYTARSMTIFKRGSGGRRIGIYMLGACDLPAVFAAKPFIAADLDGICCIVRDGDVSDARSDLLLQTMDGIVPETVRPAIERLRLAPDAFEPRLFRPTFDVPYLPGFGEFPKTVTVLSIAADLSRTLYRHKQHGYLVDPGGLWLKHDLAAAAGKPDRVGWVLRHFNRVDRLTVDDFHRNLGQVITHVRAMGSTVLVFNSPVVSPADLTYNYQFLRNPMVIRLREFNDALADLAAMHDISVVDVDRILKEEGVRDQIDFAHFPLERMIPIAREVHRILRARELL